VNALSIHSDDADDAEMPTMPTMPSLPTTLDIHLNSDTSGFHVPSALVNITYIPT
jgi:hypothetical protein